MNITGFYRSKYGLTGYLGWSPNALMKEAELIGSAAAYMGAAFSALDAVRFEHRLHGGFDLREATKSVWQLERVQHCWRQAKLRMFEAV